MDTKYSRLAVGLYSIAQTSAAAQAAYGMFSNAISADATADAFSFETNLQNDSGGFIAYNPTVGVGPQIAGLDIVVNSTTTPGHGGGAAMQIRGSGVPWDVGIGFMSGDFIHTANFQDNSQSPTIYLDKGTHTNGIDLSGGTYSGSPFKSAGFSVAADGSVGLVSLAWSHTAPTIASGFCSTASNTTISASNGTAAFDILIGGATCGIDRHADMPAATTGWVCNATDVTTPASHNVVQTGTQGSTTAVVLTDYARTTGIAQNFNPSDHIHVQCTGF